MTLTPGHIRTLVFSGGGIKGFAYIGVLRALQEYSLLSSIQQFVGTSIGSLFALCLTLGYTYEDLSILLETFDISFFQDIGLRHLVEGFGIDSGKKVEQFIQDIIAFQLNTEHKEVTFRQLYEATKKELIITTTCLDTKECTYLSHKSTPNLPVYIGIRMSMNLPGLFPPYPYKGHCYVDGGLKDNFPIRFYPPHETLGFYLGNPPQTKTNSNQTSLPLTSSSSIHSDISTQNKHEDTREIPTSPIITSWFSYLHQLWSTMFDDLNNYRKQEYWSKYWIVPIQISNIEMFELNVSLKQRKKMYRIGYLTTVRFFKQYHVKRHPITSGIQYALQRLQEEHSETKNKSTNTE